MHRDIIKHLLFVIAWGWWFCYLFEPTGNPEIVFYFGLPFVCFSFFYNRRKEATCWGIPFALPSQKGVTPEETGISAPIVSTEDFYRRLKNIEFSPELEEQFAKQPRATVALKKSMIFVKEAGKEGGRRVGALMLLFRYHLRLPVKLLIVAAFCTIWVLWLLPDQQQIEDVAQLMQLRFVKTEQNDLVYQDAKNDLAIPIDQIPLELQHALVYKEDRRFYQHWGWDWRGKIRAFVRNLKYALKYIPYRLARIVVGNRISRPAGGFQGGSTITQQLAKNLFLSNERSPRRIFKAWMLAFKLEWYYRRDKSKILEMYLNKIFFGERSYGLEVASRTYFRKHASELSLLESAILIQSLPAPEIYNLRRNEALALERAYTTVLEPLARAGKIVQGGQEFELTSQQIDRTVKQGIRDGSLAPQRREARYIRDWLVPQIKNAPYFKDLKGDFTVVTTLKADMQGYAEEAIENVLTETQQTRYNAANVSVVAMEPDGAVRTLIGSIDYGEDQYCKATKARRQPGSTFKLFPYLSVIQQGLMTVDTSVDNTPVRCGNQTIRRHGGRDRMTLTEALATSQNPAAIRVLRAAGQQNVLNLAEQFGIPVEKIRNSDISDCNLALGGGTVQTTLLNMTQAYNVIANGGLAVKPYGIIGVRTKNGTIRYWHEPETPRQIVQETHVNLMKAMLREVVRKNIPESTGRKANFDENQEIYGKTGTTDDYRNAWFIGFSDRLTTGVWVGNNDNSPMKGISGGSFPAQIFKQFMGNVGK